MIEVVSSYRSYRYLNELDNMFKARKLVFSDHLGWVPSLNGREVDMFDTYMSKPTYMLSLGEDKFYQGSLRLISTTRPNMLSEVFSNLIDKNKIPNDQSVVEISRIHSLDNKTEAFGELLVGLGVYAHQFALSNYVAVFHEGLYHMLKHIGLKMELLGEPVQYEENKPPFYVALFDVSPKLLQMVRDRYNLHDLQINF